MDGKLTGRELSVPAVFACATSRYGFESLTYNAVTHRFWTTSESTLATDGKQADARNQIGNRLRLQSFDDNFQPRDQYAYLMETPEHHSSVSNYAMGVPAMAALDDGRLLVLEREFLVTPDKFGSFVINRLFCVNPALSTPVSRKEGLVPTALSEEEAACSVEDNPYPVPAEPCQLRGNVPRTVPCRRKPGRRAMRRQSGPVRRHPARLVPDRRYPLMPCRPENSIWRHPAIQLSGRKELYPFCYLCRR